MSAHNRAALKRGIHRPVIVRDPIDFLPHGRVAGFDFGIRVAALDALIENEERLAAQSPYGWRARALEQAVWTFTSRPARGDGRDSDWESLRLLREHCRRTGKNIDDIVPREAILDALRKVQIPGIHFSDEHCAAADRRAQLPADHPDRLWMITQRLTNAGREWFGFVGPDLRLVPIAWLHRALMLDNIFEGQPRLARASRRGRAMRGLGPG